MRTIILLITLVVLPISCRFYLRRELAPSDEALQAINKIDGIFNLARKNRDIDLFLSIFDKSLKAEICGLTLTYAQFEFYQRQHPFYENESEDDVEVTEGVIEGEYLRVKSVNKNAPEEISLFTAVRNGADFKIVTMKFEGGKCSSSLLQGADKEYIF